MHGWSDTFSSSFGIACGYFLYDTVDIILDKVFSIDLKRPTVIMISHHIAIITGCLIVWYWRVCQPFVLLAAVAELRYTCASLTPAMCFCISERC